MRIARTLVGKPALYVIAAMVLLPFAMSAEETPAASFTTLYNFCGQTNCPDGRNPNGWLVQGRDGNFYGTTYTGGALGYGTIFRISSSGALATLHTFNDNDGNEPSSLIVATDGNFYGTTIMGGANCPRGPGLCGTIFRISPTGAFTTLYTFCARANCTDGYFPTAALVQGSDGNLYGTTEHGGVPGQCGSMGCGTIFRITLSGTFTTLYSFCPAGNCPFFAPDGDNPNAPLVQGADGNFYGTTQGGGGTDGCGFGCGTFFRVSPAGALISLHDFVNSSEGSAPGQIVQATDGNFYGVTSGTLFKTTAAGALTTIHLFTTDAALPVGIMQGSDRNFYGTTEQGGSGNCTLGCGTIFETNSSGMITYLHQFSGSDGAAPTGGLVQGTDGNFYGTTGQGGTSTNCQGGCGTVFKLSNGLGPFVTLQPAFGEFGGPVTIFGTSLTGASAVTFNGTSATFTVVSGTEITTTVPTGATTGTVQVTTPGGVLNSTGDFQIKGPLQFVAVTPCRLVDTRPNNPIPGGTARNFIIPQLGNCGIPTTAAAYSLNVTVAPQGRLGYLTIWPQGEVQPYVSTMNSPDGRTKANAAIVPAGNNAVSVYVTDTTNLILDIDGYFEPSVSQTLQFFPLPLCRVVDTRTGGTMEPPGLGPPSLMAQQARDLPVLSESPCLQGLPNQPVAYSFNVTVVPSPVGQTLDFLTVWPSNEPRPTVSTLNNPTATVVANAAIVPAAPNGDISVFAYNSTDLIIDVNGYFASAGGLSYYPLAPCRVYDSRSNNGPPFSGERTVNVAGSTCAPPANAASYVFNATVVPVPTLGFLTLWADGQMQPGVSTLNAYDGFVTSNMAIVPNSDGSSDAFAGDGTTHLIMDIIGYFAP